MGISSGGSLANNSMAEFFGPPRRRPLLSNSLQTLFRIYSQFPEENPFGQFADSTHTPAVWRACNAPQQVFLQPISAPRSEIKASVQLDTSGNVEVGNSPNRNETSNEEIAEVLCEDSVLNGSEMIVDELNREKETEKIDTVASDKKDTSDHMVEAHNVSQGWVGIESILMDESDDLGLLQLTDKDVNFDILKDFGMLMDTDSVGNDNVQVESSGKLLVEGNWKEDVVADNKGKDMEANKSTSGDNAGQSHDYVSTNKEKSGCTKIANEFVVTLSQDARRKDTKVYKRKGHLDPSEIGQLILKAKRSKLEGGSISGSTVIGSVGKGYQSGDTDKGISKKSKKEAVKDVNSGKNEQLSVDSEGGSISGRKVIDSVGKSLQSGDADKGKRKKSKKATVKDVKSGKSKQLSVDSEGSNGTKYVRADSAVKGKVAMKDVKPVSSTKISVDSEGSYGTKSPRADSVVNRNMLEQTVLRNKESLSQKLVCKGGPTNGEKFQYTRLQLMNLRKLAAVPEDMLITVKEISAKLHRTEHNPTVEEAIKYAGGCNKDHLGTSTEEKNAEEMVSGIMNKKKRGCSSEARKEKKKQKRRKKRAELNTKNGVKRLKLQPILKPKVVSHCRHYLKGRCHEGEKCNFSHDVIPLTKSKPCCHFARHSCMKGDDCPFDHQLSKYPCKNYLETGFCSRGEECLFSHNVIPAKEGSEMILGASKGETCSLNRLDKSNPTQQVNASSSGVTTLKNSKENSATRITQSAKAPKGLSFLSFGLPSLDNFAKQEADKSQPNVDIARTSSQPNLAISVNPANTSMSVLASPTPQRISTFPPERSSGGTSASPVLGGVNFLPLDRTSVDSKNQVNIDVAGTSGQPNPKVAEKSVELGRTLMGTPVSPTPQGVSFPSLEKMSADNLGNKNPASLAPCGNSSSFPSSGKPLTPKRTGFPSLCGPSVDRSGHKLQVGLSTDGHSGSQIETRIANVSEKFNAIHSEPRSSPTSGQCSIRAGGSVKSTTGTAQRALLSTLAFAAKYESGIKMSSTATNEVKKNVVTSGSGCKQKEPIKASAILELLFGGGSKEKQ